MSQSGADSAQPTGNGAPGTTVIVFDPKLWGGRDKGDNSQFWKTATVLRRYKDKFGQTLIDVRFDHDGRESGGHFLDGRAGEPC